MASWDTRTVPPVHPVPLREMLINDIIGPSRKQLMLKYQRTRFA